MKPGYYISERGNLLIWYPADTWCTGFQTIDAYHPLKNEYVKVHYSPKQVETVVKILEFEFIGDL